MPISKLKKNTALHEPIRIVSAVDHADLIPHDLSPWRKLLPKIHSVASTFGYHRVEPSPIESFDVFRHAVPALIDAQDRCVRIDTNSSKQFTLRPENFLSVLRAYTAHQLSEKERVTKWYYIEPTFSIEKNAISHQFEFGLVNFGEPSAISDAQMISLLKMLLEELGAANVVFEVNHRGCEACTAYYDEVLDRYLDEHRAELCDTCQENLRDRRHRSVAALEVLGCQHENCRNATESAPQIIDHLDAPCNHQLTTLLESLDELEVPYQLNPRLFGGEIFSHIVFHVKASLPGGETVELPIGIGGRQSRFVSRVTGQQIHTLAFATPASVLFDLVEKAASAPGRHDRTADVFLISLSELGAKKSLRLFMDLLRNRITVTEHFGENGIKNQLKLAERRGCPIALIVGQKEAIEGTVILREVRSGIQEVFGLDRIVEEVQKRLQD